MKRRNRLRTRVVLAAIMLCVPILSMIAAQLTAAYAADNDEYEISDLVGWYQAYPGRPNVNALAEITPDSYKDIYPKPDGRTSMYRVRGRFEKTAPGTFVLWPEEAWVGEHQKLEDFGCRIIRIEVSILSPPKSKGKRPEIIIDHYQSKENLNLGKPCGTWTYFSIEPPAIN